MKTIEEGICQKIVKLIEKQVSMSLFQVFLSEKERSTLQNIFFLINDSILLRIIIKVNGGGL